jgi:hypothetical protein
MNEEIERNLREMNSNLNKIEKITQYLDLPAYESSNKVIKDIQDELKKVNGEIEKIHRYLYTIESEITSTLYEIDTNNACREDVYVNKFLENLLKIKKDISFSLNILIFFVAALTFFVFIKYS